MKYLVFTELSTEESDRIFKAFDETTVVREMTPRKFPKQIFPDHEILGDLPKLTQTNLYFTIYETDDPKQLENVVAFWKSRTEFKTLKRCFVPITDMSSLHQTMKEQSKTTR